MRTMFVIIAALTLQGCAQYLELVRIGRSEEWQQEQRQHRLQRLERELGHDLHKLRKQQ